MEGRGCFTTENIGSRAARFQASVGQPEAVPGGKGCTNDQVVLIHRQQGCISARQIGIDDPMRGEVFAKDATFDPARCVLNNLLHQYPHRGAVIVATIRNIERADKLAGRIAHWRIHAADTNVASGEMFVAVDRDGPTLDQACADTIGAFPALAPYPAGGQTNSLKEFAIASQAARFQHDAVIIGQHHGTAGSGNGLEQLVEKWPRDVQHQLMALPSLGEVATGHEFRCAIGPGIETMP